MAPCSLGVLSTLYTGIAYTSNKEIALHKLQINEETCHPQIKQGRDCADLTSVDGLDCDIQVEQPLAGSCCKDIMLRESLFPLQNASRMRGSSTRVKVHG